MTLWILKNSQGVVEMCERLNRHKSRDRARKSNMKTFDFEQMYTKIELDALVEKMDEVVAFDFRKQRELTRDTVLELSLDGEHKCLRNKQPVHKNSAKRCTWMRRYSIGEYTTLFATHTCT